MSILILKHIPLTNVRSGLKAQIEDCPDTKLVSESVDTSNLTKAVRIHRATHEAHKSMHMSVHCA